LARLRSFPSPTSERRFADYREHRSATRR
jgi:hypothetical protein